MKVKTEGLGSLSLDKFMVEVIDQNDKVIFDDQKNIDISALFIVGGISETVNYTLDLEKIFKLSDYDGYDTFPLLYDDLLKGNTHKLRLTVTGSSDSSLTAQIIYK